MKNFISSFSLISFILLTGCMNTTTMRTKEPPTSRKCLYHVGEMSKKDTEYRLLLQNNDISMARVARKMLRYHAVKVKVECTHEIPIEFADKVLKATKNPF